ncbi:MAG TPA: hypothetical protein VH682_23515 [Gemmataceae bacterium]
MRHRLTDTSQGDLRPEATPLPYHQLSAVQLKAYRWLVDRLARAVESAGRPKPAGEKSELTGYDLDFERRSRVVVVSGERGTGKTSVLLSVIHDVSERKIPDLNRPPPGQVAGDDTALDEQTRKDIESLFGRLVWLNMLDMSPLPASANLFSAILVRIEEAATRGLAAVQEEKPRSFLDTPERYDSPLEKLRRLQTDVAVAWEGNLRARSGALDTNAFAAEVRRTEFVRLRLNARLTEVLDGLASELSRRAEVRPEVLFVLPIDDFDLNPPRCLQLLEMLRTLSVPRLFCVVLGDVDVAETMCALQLAADVAQVAGDAPASGFMPMHRYDVRATIANVSGNAIRKLLPPSHRVHLTALQTNQAIGLRPPGKVEGTPTISDWLKRIPLPKHPDDYQINRRFKSDGSGRSVSTLSDFLFAENPPIGTTEVDEPFYRARKFLEMPLRQLVDLWLALEKTVTGLEAGADLSEQFRKELHWFCRDILRAEESLSPPVRRRLRTAFDLDPDTNWAVSLEPFQLAPVMYPAQVDCRVGEMGDALSWTNRAQGTTGWEFRSKPQTKAPDPLLLASASANLLIFYTDLVTLSRGNGEPNGLLPLVHFAMPFARTGYRFNSRELPWLPWPFPPVLTFWEADQFLDAWTKFVRRMDQSLKQETYGDVTPSLVYHWISFGSAVLSGEKSQAAIYIPRVNKQEWEILIPKLTSLYDNSSNSPRVRDGVHGWLRRALSLLNSDVLNAQEDIRDYFRESAPLKELCKSEGKHFAEWNETSLRETESLKNVVTEFLDKIRQYPVWWS